MGCGRQGSLSAKPCTSRMCKPNTASVLPATPHPPAFGRHLPQLRGEGFGWRLVLLKLAPAVRSWLNLSAYGVKPGHDGTAEDNADRVVPQPRLTPPRSRRRP